MTKEQIVQRIAELEHSAEAQKADLMATLGAIQDCRHWLAVIVAEETTSIQEDRGDDQ